MRAPTTSEAADRLLFPGFRRATVETKGLVVNDSMANGETINTLVGGSGPPLLLIHGHPETHVAWHKVAGTLAQRYTVVLTDPEVATAINQVQAMRGSGF